MKAPGYTGPVEARGAMQIDNKKQELPVPVKNRGVSSTLDRN
jgi:hypothetical protein